MIIKKYNKIIICITCAAMLVSACSKTEVISNSATPVIDRNPPDCAQAMTLMQKGYGLEKILTPDESGSLMLRCADLSSADLTDYEDRLMKAEFDSKTVWPDSLPEGFDPGKLMETGKDPGLGVRNLHKQGITGKGVGIAIIDQTLLTGHIEYADRLRYYKEYNKAAELNAQMHGPAVASIAAGKTVGVAPEAILYYIADTVSTNTAEGKSERDLSNYAQDIERILELNDTLPKDEKIRVISISAGYMPDTKGAKEMDAAIAKARQSNVAVVWVSSKDELMNKYIGMGYNPYGNPNSAEDFLPGMYLTDFINSGEYSASECLLIPMDRRAIASPTGNSDYAYYPDGGTSWTMPYIAGLYALACQVKSEVTFDEFTQTAMSVSHPVHISHGGKEYQYGRTFDPAEVLELLQSDV